MPIAYIAVGVLALGMVVAWTLLQRQIKGLKRDLEESARDEAASEKRIRELLGAQTEPTVDKEKRPRLRLVPVFAAFGAAGTVLGWVRDHSGPVAVSAATVAAVTVLVIAGSSSSDTRRALPPEPAPIAPSEQPRSPSLVTELPAPEPTTRTRRGATAAPDTSVPGVGTTAPVLPPPVSHPTQTVTPVPPPVTTTTTPVTTPPGVGPDRCLLGAVLPPLLGICVPT